MSDASECVRCGHVHATRTVCLVRISGSGPGVVLCSCYGVPKPPPEIRVGQTWSDQRTATHMTRKVVAYTPGAAMVTLYDWTRQRHTMRVTTLRKHFHLFYEPREDA